MCETALAEGDLFRKRACAPRVDCYVGRPSGRPIHMRLSLPLPATYHINRRLPCLRIHSPHLLCTRLHTESQAPKLQTPQKTRTR